MASPWPKLTSFPMVFSFYYQEESELFHEVLSLTVCGQWGEPKGICQGNGRRQVCSPCLFHSTKCLTLKQSKMSKTNLRTLSNLQKTSGFEEVTFHLYLSLFMESKVSAKCLNVFQLSSEETRQRAQLPTIMAFHSQPDGTGVFTKEWNLHQAWACSAASIVWLIWCQLTDLFLSILTAAAVGPWHPSDSPEAG